MTKYQHPLNEAGFMLPVALLLVFLITTVTMSVLDHSNLGDQQRSLGLFKAEAGHQARMGLESTISRIRNFTAGPTTFPNWTPLTIDATEQSDANKCGISSQFASNSIVRMSQRLTYNNHHLRYYAVIERDATIGLSQFSNQWRIVSCVLSSSPGFTETRSTLLRYGIQNGSAVTARGTPIDLRSY